MNIHTDPPTPHIEATPPTPTPPLHSHPPIPKKPLLGKDDILEFSDIAPLIRWVYVDNLYGYPNIKEADKPRQVAIFSRDKESAKEYLNKIIFSRGRQCGKTRMTYEAVKKMIEEEAER